MTRSRLFGILVVVFLVGSNACKDDPADPPPIWECGIREAGGRCTCAAINRNTMLADDIPRLDPPACPAEFSPCCHLVYDQCNCFSEAGLASRGQTCDELASATSTVSATCPPP